MFTRDQFIKKMESWQSFLCCLWFLLTLSSFSCGNYPLLDVDTNMRIVLVPTDTPVGTIVYRLRASDSDNNFPLDFEILGALGKSLLTLDFLGCSLTESICQADVILMKHLDVGRTYEFHIRVRDQTGDFTKVPAVIQATEGTSFHSFFGPKILYVAENTPIGTQLDKFTVLKNSLNSRTVLFEMREPRNRIELKQKLLSNNRTEGRLLLRKVLDFETEPWFTFSLLSMNAYTNVSIDTRNVLVSEVIVAVVDSQDTPPFFTLFPTSVEIPKDIQINDLITRISATDGDRQNKRLVSYGFLTDANPFVPFFDLDPLTGEIRLKRSIQELSTILVRPTDPIKLTVLVEEIVADNEPIQSVPSSPSNERTMANITFWLGSGSSLGPPIFSKDSYVAEFTEESLPGTEVEFHGGSPTISHNNPNELLTLNFGNFDPTYKSSLEIVPREGRGNFTFDIRVVDGRAFDYETVKVVKLDLVGIVTSTNLKSIVELTIHIRDKNDQYPIFTNSEYIAEIPENSPKGTKVVKVHATDKDTGSYGQIVYTNIHGTDAFHLDPISGQITVEKPNLLDRELEPEIRFYVEAKDGGYTEEMSKNEVKGIRNIATSTVVVRLSDINDNAPTFAQKYYQAILTPDLSTLRSSLTVKAFDLDEEDTQNSKIKYQLGSDARGFYIDPVTGDLRLRSPFVPNSGSNGPFLGKITIKASDMGAPEMASETTVQLFSQDMVTREMQFVFPNSPEEIKRDSKKIEKMLSTLTGGVALIQNITPYKSSAISSTSLRGRSSYTNAQQQDAQGGDVDLRENPGAYEGYGNTGNYGGYGPRRQSLANIPSSDQALVTALVQFPVTETPTRVDLAAWTKDYMKPRSPDPANITAERETIELYRSENKILFWILIIFIILLILAFAIFLFCLYLPGCWLHTYCQRFEMVRRKQAELEEDEKEAARQRHHSRRSRKVYPGSRRGDDDMEYDNSAGGGYRKEAWSGEDGGGGGGGRGYPPGGGSRRYPPPHSRKMNDVMIDDWEFNEHERGGDRGDEVGQRWQGGGGGGGGGGGQRRHVNYAGGTHPGDQGFTRPREEGGRTNSRQNMAPPANVQQQQQQQGANTRFYRTEAGEVLELDYEGGEGKEMLMRRFMNDHENQESGQTLERQEQDGEFGFEQTGPGTGESDRPKAAAGASRRAGGGGGGGGGAKDRTMDEDELEGKKKKEGHHKSRDKDRGRDRDKSKSKSKEKEKEKDGRRSRSRSREREKHKSKSKSKSESKSKSPSKSPSRSKSREGPENPLTADNLLLAQYTGYPMSSFLKDEESLSHLSKEEREKILELRKESKDSDLLRILENEAAEDGDGVGGLGIGVGGPMRRNKMFEKKSVFTIAYDEMATEKVLGRPETDGETTIETV